MTDKERLEEIKELVKKIESILYDKWRQQELTNLIESLYYADHINWLINRVEELEQQNKRYREALSIISANLPLDGKEDYVYIARQALEDENEED